MADNLTKILITSVFISMLLGTTMEIYNQETGWLSTDVDKTLIESEAIADIMGDSSDWDAERENQLTDQTIGTPIGWGKSLWNVLRWGFTPMPISEDLVQTQIEKIFLRGLFIFKIVQTALFALMGYRLWINRQ